MKKICAFILSLFVFLCAATAIGEEIDISSLTFDELIELQGKITNRINEVLSTSSDAIYLGEYTCGVDIKPGRYLLTALVGSSYFKLYLFADASAMDDGDLLISKTLYDGETFDIEIEEGMILEVSHGTAMVTPRIKPSWAP